MGNEGDLDKRKVNIRVPLEDVYRTIRKFHVDGDKGDAPAFVRAIQTATHDVALTEADYLAIAEEVKKNTEDRMAQREARHGHNH